VWEIKRSTKGEARRARQMLAGILLAALAGSTAVAQEQIDPVVASPDLYTVLLENEHVRVIEYRIEPGQSEPWHTHPAKVMYVLESGTLKITLPDGESLVAEEEAGVARWMGPVGRHFGENVGATPVRILIVEVKAAAGSVPEEDPESLRALVEPDR
jgi:quercetin dioxygenase-like cupin family protein